ncbi:hypothetical protein Tco_1464748 [Tanacetum coccineum]
MQGVSKTDFENYVKANDAILRNMQNQGQGSSGFSNVIAVAIQRCPRIYPTSIQNPSPTLTFLTRIVKERKKKGEETRKKARDEEKRRKRRENSKNQEKRKKGRDRIFPAASSPLHLRPHTTLHLRTPLPPAPAPTQLWLPRVRTPAILQTSTTPHSLAHIAPIFLALPLLPSHPTSFRPAHLTSPSTPLPRDASLRSSSSLRLPSAPHHQLPPKVR